MAISYEDRLKIGRYIDVHQDLSFLGTGNSFGPCMSFVQNLIENATGKRILRANNIFQNNIATLTNKIRIFNINDFDNLAFNGEIICITYPGDNIRHYALCYHIRYDNTTDYNIIGANGFMYDYQPMVRFKGVILSKIRSTDFNVSNTGEFFYTNQQRNNTLSTGTIPQNYMYKIPYDLR